MDAMDIMVYMDDVDYMDLMDLFVALTVVVLSDLVLRTLFNPFSVMGLEGCERGMRDLVWSASTCAHVHWGGRGDEYDHFTREARPR